MTASQPFTTILISSNFKDYKYNWVWYKNLPTNYPNAKRRPLTKHEDICVWQLGNQHYNPQKQQDINQQTLLKVVAKVKYIMEKI